MGHMTNLPNKQPNAVFREPFSWQTSSASSSPMGKNATARAFIKELNNRSTVVRVDKPSFRKFNVEATDDFSASVAKLSKWLASDPTKKKKDYMLVRKGNNVVDKSQTYETQDLEACLRKKLNIPIGTVANKMKTWQCESSETSSGSGPKVESNEKGFVEEAISNQIDEGCLEHGSRTDTVEEFRRRLLENSSYDTQESPQTMSMTSSYDTDDSARPTSMIEGRRQWLMEALGHKTEGVQVETSTEHEFEAVEAKASRDEQGDDACSSKGTQSTQESSGGHLDDRQKHIKQVLQLHLGKIDSSAVCAKEINTGAREIHLSGLGDGRGNGDTVSSTTTLTPNRDEGVNDKPIVAEEVEGASDLCNDVALDRPSMLEAVERWSIKDRVSEMKLITQVQMRKEKLERMEKEFKRRSGPYGLLKPTWKKNKGEGKPSDGYTKGFHGNVAPKKTLAELP